MAHDPYHHLHDEAYTAAFEGGFVGADEMVFMVGRARIPLSGSWQFVPDTFDEGLRQQWYRDPPSDPFALDLPRDCDWSGYRVEVPSVWNLNRPEWFHFEGSGWYSRDFIAPALVPGSRVLLRVGAANYLARVFVNGAFAGAHRGGSTPFFIDVTPHLIAGTNTLRIQVENRRAPDRVPMHHIDWFNYGGLFREVDLVVLPAAHVRDLRVCLTPEGVVRITVVTSKDGRADVRFLGREFTIDVGGGRASVEVAAPTELWSPDRPHMHPIEVRFVDDIIADRVGLRTVATCGTDILLNGEPIWLKGICCHEDDAELGRVTSDADLARRFDHVRALGANAVRLSHYPHHEKAAALADERGILLIEEIPVYWAIDFTNPSTRSDASNQLREMIRRDYNRASVILWGVGNENADTDARLDFMGALADTARSEDDSRLITAACLINRETFRVEDRLAASLDVIGFNEYFGWYERPLSRLRDLLDRTQVEKPLIITETGADAVSGHAGSPGQLFSEAYQASVLSEQLEIATAAPNIQGIFPWILYDFRTERRQTAIQRGWNLKGLIDRDKQRMKAAFHAVASLYKA
ncbi:MAG: glycoside hydrolase family 2 TIM barrel-domain containing protein [Pseudomonadota bacterium]